ncbi:penicillin-binding protein 1B [Salinisphaera sp. USBA-960]|uniref:penicillin-binding protein 1B n=1 Tax=Salinisphaera orenii TaxID=856731 RepID=UPI0013A6042E|nr:penicillin-binding protein 1B [Salifodinibacter halophilus]NNC25868.1 penicillin-binding protein 1B [Salifodinibacter halophilus]
MAAGKKSRGRRRGGSKRAKPSISRRLLAYLFLGGCLVLAGISVYAAYLNGTVQEKFAGTRWKLPAKVYAAPMQLYTGKKQSLAAVVEQLKRQGYRAAAQSHRQGSFHRDGNQLTIHARGFDFPDGERAPRTVQLRFKNGTISGFKSVDDKESLSLIRIDPPLIGSIYPNKGADRILVKLSDLPPMLPAGLITVEDKSFMHNFGISPKGIVRAAWEDLKAGSIVEGGSTITQQLVKNFYLNSNQTFARKAREGLMAILLDAHYSKPAILEAYINEVYLGQDGNHAIRGFGLASYYYFNTPVDELGPARIALLVAMVKGPSYYDPRAHPKRARRRRNLVLDMFHEAGFLKEQAWKRAKSAPLGVSSEKNRRTSRYPDFIDLVRQQLHGQYTEAQLTEEGLRVFTTLHPGIQRHAQASVRSQLDAIEKRRGNIESDSLQSSAIVTSVEGGRILALVGGRKSGYAGFNRALDIQRPIGSLIKPVTYLTAMKYPSKYSVITPLDDSPLSVKQKNGKVWKPDNYSKRSHGTDVPLYYALEHSYNLASSRLALDLGIPKVIKTLRQLGYPGEPTAVPSVALGAVNMSPLQVAQVYNTIASGGYYKKLTAIQDVTDRQGNPLSAYKLKLKQVIDSAPAYLDTWMMRRVARHGTGSGIYRVLPNQLQLAGKTGTTNQLRDSWFAGFSGNRVISVWVGRDNNDSAHLTGATGALHIWSHIMSDVGAQSLTMSPPANVQRVPLAMTFRPNKPNAPNFFNTGSDAQCPEATSVPFTRGYVPSGVDACESDILARDRKQQPTGGGTGSDSRGGHQSESDGGEDDQDKSLLDKIF